MSGLIPAAAFINSLSWGLSSLAFASASWISLPVMSSGVQNPGSRTLYPPSLSMNSVEPSGCSSSSVDGGFGVAVGRSVGVEVGVNVGVGVIVAVNVGVANNAGSPLLA